jgi:hypothetical protein
MEIKLWDQGYVKTIEDKIGCKYSEINKNKDNRIKAVTSIAAISRGKDKSNNPEKRYQHLLKEAAPDYCYYKLKNMEERSDKTIDNVAGRPLEYIPVVLKYKFEGLNVEIYDEDEKYIKTTSYLHFTNKITKFGHITYDGDFFMLYTNARALLNSGFKESDIPFNRSVKDYFVVEVRAPYFTFAQMRTHGLLSQVAVSERVTSEDYYWLPDDILKRLKETNYQELYKRGIKTKEDLLSYMLDIISINEGIELLKNLGYKKEIYNRWHNHMKYKTWIIGGYLNNPHQWGHFLLERGAFEKILKNWTQEQTKETAIAIKQIIDDYI